MKIKLLAYFVILIFFAQITSGISSNLKGEYEKKETIIIEIYGNILQTIKLEDVALKRGTQTVGFNGEIRKLGNRHFLWLTAPQTTAEYTLIIEDIVEDKGNGPEITDYSQKFNVTSNSTGYSIEPGIVFANANFNIEATLFDSVSQSIAVDFPQQRNINLNQGTTTINFDMRGVEGIKLIMINVGKYIVPAYIIGSDGPVCNNGIFENDNGEVCECGNDGVCGNFDDNLNSKTCSTQGFDFGNLSCSSDCLSFDTTQCMLQSIETDENLTESNNTTNEMNETENATSNEDIFYFKFNPPIIQSTILFSSSIPPYFFEIINEGNLTLENISLEYNRNKFAVIPTENISIYPNSSKIFELKVINVTGNPVRGGIIARAGEAYQFMLFSLTFTRNETEVKTEYLKNSSQEAVSYYCSELSGKICTGEEVCSADEIKTIDGSCCITSCAVESKGGSKAWIGYLIAAILILVLAVIYFRYKKTGKTTGSEIMRSTMAQAEKSLP